MFCNKRIIEKSFTLLYSVLYTDIKLFIKMKDDNIQILTQIVEYIKEIQVSDVVDEDKIISVTATLEVADERHFKRKFIHNWLDRKG